MTTRARIVEIAQSYVGSNDRADFWQNALGYDPGKSKHWCGAFWLACLKHAGVTDIKWGINGTGVQALKLRQTKSPEPGDLGYIDQPFQHHFLVESVSSNTYTSIDGNAGSPGVQRKNRAFKTPGVIFYSIASLLTPQTIPAPPSWDDETEPNAKPPRLPVRLGSTGAHVEELQTKLNSHGAQLKVDGVAGLYTVAAIQAFQRRAGLSDDGIVGAITWGKLDEV